MLSAAVYHWVSWTMSELAKKPVSFLEGWLLMMNTLCNWGQDRLEGSV